MSLPLATKNISFAITTAPAGTQISGQSFAMTAENVVSAAVGGYALHPARLAVSSLRFDLTATMTGSGTDYGTTTVDGTTHQVETEFTFSATKTASIAYARSASAPSFALLRFVPWYSDLFYGNPFHATPAVLGSGAYAVILDEGSGWTTLYTSEVSVSGVARPSALLFGDVEYAVYQVAPSTDQAGPTFILFAWPATSIDGALADPGVVCGYATLGTWEEPASGNISFIAPSFDLAESEESGGFRYGTDQRDVVTTITLDISVS